MVTFLFLEDASSSSSSLSSSLGWAFLGWFFLPLASFFLGSGLSSSFSSASSSSSKSTSWTLAGALFLPLGADFSLTSSSVVSDLSASGSGSASTLAAFLPLPLAAGLGFSSTSSLGVSVSCLPLLPRPDFGSGFLATASFFAALFRPLPEAGASSVWPFASEFSSLCSFSSAGGDKSSSADWSPFDGSLSRELESSTFFLRPFLVGGPTSSATCGSPESLAAFLPRFGFLSAIGADFSFTSMSAIRSGSDAIFPFPLPFLGASFSATFTSAAFCEN